MAQGLDLNNKHRPALSGWPMLIFWWAMILFALHASTHMVGAGDTWVAMACGRHFIDQGVDTNEPFSANSHREGPTEEEVKNWPSLAQKITKIVGLDTVRYWHPTGWVNQNWLTHVIFYWLTHDSPLADAETFDKPIEGQNISYNSLVYWKYGLYIITIIAVYYTGRVLGANPALSAVFACFALFVGRTFLDIRPAGFSNMLTAVLLLIFVLTVYRNYLFIWLIVPLGVLWCNLHGGYVYMFLVLVPFVGLHFLNLLPKKTRSCILMVFGWLFFYALAYKFHSHPRVESIALLGDKFLYVIIGIIALRIYMAFSRKVVPTAIVVSDIIITLIVFAVCCSRFYPGNLETAMRDRIFVGYAKDARLTFFVAFIGFSIAAVLLTNFQSRLKKISWKALLHTVTASAMAFIAMIIFNPFKLTNLTHTFIITASEDAKLWKTVNEWHPAFEWKNPVGDEIPFLIMYIIAWILLVFWALMLLLKPKSANKGSRQIEQSESKFQWPTIDLPLLTIAAMTVYMAVGSRRFIPVAAIAACPIMAVFLTDGIKTISALCNLKLEGILRSGQVPKFMQRWLLSAVIPIVAFLTCWWGYWYKTIYLDPWPDHSQLSSVFMRMTASYAKPFRTCQFIRDNELEGKMFNYWTEGGFIAYGQVPDPNAGRTPLQLFMDGRAQAAYDTSNYRRWMHIMTGGTAADKLRKSGRKFTASDYKKIAEWYEQEFRKENVWVVLMPINQINSVLVKTLDYSKDYRPIFINDGQRLYVDIKSVQGQALYKKLFTGQLKFPDGYSKLLTLGFTFTHSSKPEDVEKGLKLLKQALKISPSQIVIIELISSGNRVSHLKKFIHNAVEEYFNDFEQNKEKYKKQDGYRKKLTTAIIAANYLSNVNGKNKSLAKRYQTSIANMKQEQERIKETARW
ncbi:MAG: hypothetical protein K8R02_08495 [Anaerohalosphaeraceae bacterium]|nr:hypothetical protein [Anaerohalosphaeraceae bacterium]